MLCVTRNRFAARPQRQPGLRRERRDGLLREVVAGVQARSDRGGAEVQLVQRLSAALQFLRGVTNVGGEAAELLAQRDRHGILKVRASGLQHVRERRALSRRARRPGRAPPPAVPAEPSRIASRVAVGNTSFVDWPMLT